MGGTQFEAVGVGETAKEAFSNAVADARYEYGHRGYTGSLAEKYEFVLAEPPGTVSNDDFVNYIIDASFRNYDRIPEDCLSAAKKYGKIYDDKWGPAVCIHLGGNKYLFIGWASS